MRASTNRSGWAKWGVLICLVWVTGWGLTLNLRTVSAAGAETDTAPADVVQRAQIALARMQRIAIAMQQYADDFRNRDHWPKSPHLLYPDWIDDPNVFWHPGDVDPAPQTINNSVPNAVDSAQVSFDISYDPNVPRSPLVIRDWSSTNNAGYFVLEYTLECGGDTIPPGGLPVSFPLPIAQSRLRGLAQASLIYAFDNNERLPTDPYDLWTSGQIACPRLVWHPGDSDPQPTDITTGALDEPNSIQISFELLVPGGRLDQLPADTVMWQDNTPANNGGAGRNKVRLDGSVYFDPIFEYNDYNGDSAIGMFDFDALSGCLTGPYQFITDDFCRHFDRDQDHDVDIAAVADFQLNFDPGG